MTSKQNIPLFYPVYLMLHTRQRVNIDSNIDDVAKIESRSSTLYFKRFQKRYSDTRIIDRTYYTYNLLALPM